MRLTISLPDSIGEALQARAKNEKRPVSNMVAVILEAALVGDLSSASTPVLAGKRFNGPDPRKKP